MWNNIVIAERFLAKEWGFEIVGKVMVEYSCEDGSIYVKSTEVNTEKGLVTKCFQEIKFILSLSEILAKVAFYQEKPKVELTG